MFYVLIYYSHSKGKGIEQMEMVYNEETGKYELKEELYATIEIETAEDYNFIVSAIKYYKEYLSEQ